MYMKKKNKITDNLVELYKEVTPRGRKLLDELVGEIIFNLENIRMSIYLEEDKRHEKD